MAVLLSPLVSKLRQTIGSMSLLAVWVVQGDKVAILLHICAFLMLAYAKAEAGRATNMQLNTTLSICSKMP